MEEVARARGAAREAIEDISPPRLRDAMEAHLGPSSMIPGVLTLLSARVVDSSADRCEVERRAAGVQLIYEGLRLTRYLVYEEPWTADAEPNAPGDLDVLVADVLVARGFRLLARTEAASKAVETVREFGREQTEAYADHGPTARSLEANVFELAVIAGATATGTEPPLPLRQYVVSLARSLGEPPLPSAVEGLPETIEEVMGRVSVDPGVDEAVRPSSATDP